jgi:hypothetical protein
MSKFPLVMLSAHFYWASADWLTELIALTCVLLQIGRTLSYGFG